MSEIELRGSLDWLQIRLNWIRLTILSRKTGGWKLFQSDEEWLYDDAGDAKVCPTCKSNAEQNPWKGHEIPHFFPNYEFISARGAGFYIPPVVVRPRVHSMEEYLYLGGECRCRLTLLFPLETMEERLHLEKMETLIRP